MPQTNKANTYGTKNAPEINFSSDWDMNEKTCGKYNRPENTSI